MIYVCIGKFDADVSVVTGNRRTRDWIHSLSIDVVAGKGGLNDGQWVHFQRIDDTRSVDADLGEPNKIRRLIHCLIQEKKKMSTDICFVDTLGSTQAVCFEGEMVQEINVLCGGRR